MEVVLVAGAPTIESAHWRTHRLDLLTCCTPSANEHPPNPKADADDKTHVPTLGLHICTPPPEQ
eukprot:2081645-Prymnesium_polylepis.1